MIFHRTPYNNTQNGAHRWGDTPPIAWTFDSFRDLSRTEAMGPTVATTRSPSTEESLRC